MTDALPNAVLHNTAAWFFRFCYLLLLLRLIVNWVGMSSGTHSTWMSWIERLSDPLVAPFRGLFQARFDFSPVLSYFILSWIVEPLLAKVIGF